MKRKTLNTLLLILLSGGILSGQSTTGSSEMKLTVREAQDFAVKNNKAVKGARLDYEASRIALWTSISNILPQVNASASFNDNLKLMTTLLPGQFFGDTTGKKYPVRFGSQFNTGASVQASMVIFNAPALLGIETTKLASQLSKDNLTRSEQDIKESVSSIYYLILVTEKSLDIVGKNIQNLNETLKSTKAMLSAGMAEQTDVDQMQANVTMVENSRSNLERTNEVNYNLLRLQLGVSIDTKIILSENLDDLVKTVNVESLLAQKFDYNDNINFKLVYGQEQLSSLALKTQKATVLPSLAAFYSYGKTGMGDKVKSQQWFPNSVTGLQLSVPIFASGQRYTNIKRAQINLNKARLTKEMLTDQLEMQEKQLRYNLVNANLQYTSQKANVEVANRVYTSTENKFKHGMASSLDLTQANQIYLQAENNYVSALMNLLQSKLSLDKLLNNF